MTTRSGWKPLPATTRSPSSGAKKVSVKRSMFCPGCAECARRTPTESISFSKQTLHTARNGFLRVLYPYHPLYKQVLEVFGAAGGLRDLVYVRMPNNATRGIPAWMFDDAICGSDRYVASPFINCHVLWSLARLLDGHWEGRGIERHGSSLSRSKAISIASAAPDDTGAGQRSSSKRTNARRRSK